MPIPRPWSKHNSSLHAKSPQSSQSPLGPSMTSHAGVICRASGSGTAASASCLMTLPSSSSRVAIPPSPNRGHRGQVFGGRLFRSLLHQKPASRWSQHSSSSFLEQRNTPRNVPPVPPAGPNHRSARVTGTFRRNEGGTSLNFGAPLVGVSCPLMPKPCPLLGCSCPRYTDAGGRGVPHSRQSPASPATGVGSPTKVSE